MRRVRRKSTIDYILPFLILLGVGVIGILGYQLWSSFEKQGKADVYFYLAEGKAKILPYGQSTWDNAFSGTKLLLGDSLKTSSLGKLVMLFFNDTVIRLGNDSAITLTDVSKGSDQEKIVLNLDNGLIWVNGKKSPGVKESHYDVRTTHMLVKAKGTVFEVENNETEVVRVFDGEISVDILVNTDGKERVADTVTVGVGQQIVLDEATIKAYEEHQTLSILQMISEDFKATEWYSWNMKEDENPTDFTLPGRTTAQENDATPEETTDSHESQQTEETEESQENADDTTKPDAPTILKPVGAGRITDQGRVTISGSVEKGTSKVVVEQFISGHLDSYTLSKFKEGDTAWTYTVAESLGNLLDGQNVYKIYALNNKGLKSEPAEITITYNKPVTQQTQETQETQQTQQTQEPQTSPPPSPTPLPSSDAPPPFSF